MRHLLVTCFFIFLSLDVIAGGYPPPPRPAAPIHSSPPPHYAPDRILVKFKPGAAASELRALPRGDHLLRTIPGLGVQVLQVPVGSVPERLALYQHNPNVVYAEPDLYRLTRLIPDEGTDAPPPTGTGDNHFSDQWALNNTGQLYTYSDPYLGLVQTTGTPDADIDAPEGWDISTGSSAVKIAILDTGIDCRNASNAEGSLEFGPGKCIEQVNFVSDYNVDALDYLGHGTEVAGIAAAATNNGIGIAGVGWNSSVGSLKACFAYQYYPYPELEPDCGCYDYIGVCPVSASAEAILYAASHGYQVANMSYASDEMSVDGDPISYGGYSQTEADAVSVAWASGVVLVAAAGNESADTPLYPAAYDQVIAVAATDAHDDLAGFSSFGSSWVSLLAPGQNIYSTVPNDFCVFYADLLGLVFDPNSDACLDWGSGTSMSSPHVAGAAAVVWANFYASSLANPSTCFDGGIPCNEVVRAHLENGAETTGAGGQNMLAWSMHGRLSLAGALTSAGAPAAPLLVPSSFTAASGDQNGNGVAVLSWSYGVADPASFEVEQNTLHPKNGRIIATSYITVSGDIRSFIDDVDPGDYSFRARAESVGGQFSGWTPLSATITVADVGGSSSGGSSGGNGGSGGGKGKPAK